MITIYDIETEPLPAADLDALQPQFDAPRNLKDPAKITAAIAEKREEWRERAALSPFTGRILAIGYAQGDLISIDYDEAETIANFFARFTACAGGSQGRLVGWNTHGFDLPFICRRALVHGITIPAGLIPNGHSRFYWPPWCVDLRDIWGFGEHQPAGSLDVVCRTLGLGGKNGEGKDFARLYHGTRIEQMQALKYLENDLRLTAKLAERLGVR